MLKLIRDLLHPTAPNPDVVGRIKITKDDIGLEARRKRWRALLAAKRKMRAAGIQGPRPLYISRVQGNG
jgi:hypothetical protein